jgi:hypothetical protein
MEDLWNDGGKYQSVVRGETSCTANIHILTKLQAIPAKNRGGYYPWFLKHLDIFEPHPNAVVPLSARHLCASCGVSASVRCSACRKVWYCSKKCQENEWSGHLIDCYPGRPITSADHLRAAVHRQKLPEDLEILLDYGFTCVGEVDGKILLDCYQVIFDEGVRSRDLHQWKESGQLLAQVEKLLQSLDAWKTLHIIHWFNEHRYAFDSTMPAPDHTEAGAIMAEKIMAAQVRLWNRVGDFPSHDRDEIYSAIRNWPKPRANFFLFYAMLPFSYPGPDWDNWVAFGFCACHDESEEQFLSETYKLLVERCTYDNFLAAYSTSGIIQLLDANDLRGRHMIHPYLEDVLSGSPVMFKSVWYLKKHVQDRTSVQSDMEPSVRADYRFMFCTSDSEYQDLKGLYKSIFERRDTNPLKLHEACVSGSLYAYVLGLFPELKKKKNRAKKFERLLRNMYPLQSH